MRKYENIADFIRQNMEELHGDFKIAVTDHSETEEGCLLATIHPEDRNGDTADFYLHVDGREEYTTII